MTDKTIPFAGALESIEVRLNGEVVRLDLKTYAGRYTARAAAYALLMEEGKEDEAALILDAVGREG